MTDLNPEQALALQHLTGPLLIVAGAGSGKTRTLTERLHELIRTGTARPDEILAITFTNKAAGEMRERLARRLSVEGLWVLTFHAFGSRILRREIDRLGYDKAFLIYDTDDQLAAVRQVMAGLRLSERDESARSYLWWISRAKNDGLGPEETLRGARDFLEERRAQVYRAYQALLRQYQALDFDDLLLLTIRLFEEQPAVLEKYQERFRFILVDEFQDTNRVQYRLLRLLAARYRNLTAVGDPDQSIYGWRGANLENILTFERDYPEARVIFLNQNYRSTQTILAAANAVVKNNARRREKTLWTANQPGEAILFLQAPDENREGEAVAAEVERLIQEGRAPQDIAILYRVNAQSRALEEGLFRHRLPYRVVGGLRFYERREVKDVLSYLRLAVNPRDSLGLERALTAPRRGIGPASLALLRDWAVENGVDQVTAFRRAEAPGLTGKARREAAAFGELIAEAAARAAQENPASVLEFILEASGYLAELRKDGSPEAQARLENLQALVRKAAEFGPGGTGEFLEAVALLSDLDQLREEEAAVTLMTVHSAKGLEFPVVFLTGLEEGLFPHARSDTASALEEERRLFYVALTRARERIILTRALRRSTWGRDEPTMLSRFVREVPAELLWSEPAPTVRESAGLELRVGQRVRHPRFGPGTVVALAGEGEGLEVAVAFPGGGVRRFIAEFAGLSPLEGT